jgi:hypothetical protein
MRQTGIFTLALLFALASCQGSAEQGKDEKQKDKQTDKKETDMDDTFKAGTFGYDVELMKTKEDAIVLSDGPAQILLSAKYQGRVMTSTVDGAEGKSFGWLNHELIKKDTILDHMNGYGGEDRFWMGPEGGQFSIFFAPGTKQVFENWQTPSGIDTEEYKLVSKDAKSAVFGKEMELVNYSGTELSIALERKIDLLGENELKEIIGQELPDGLKMVGFQSVNTITNKGDDAWTEQTGMPSIWILGMFNPTPGTTILLPYKKGDEAEYGKIVTDDYFGKVENDRLKIMDGMIYFKGDGKKRGKIGVSPQRALPVAGSYDANNQVLTIINYTLPEGETSYVNSLWEEQQEEPFKGDALNSYNDGPLEDGSQMGPFYELETSSPAANLKPDESLTHVHKTFHIQGDESLLNEITLKVFGVSIKEIKTALK